MKIQDTYLKYKYPNGATILVNLEELIENGVPIDTETDLELERVSDDIFTDEPIEVHVKGGIAECDSNLVTIIDHD